MKVKIGIEPLDLGVPEGILRSSTIILYGPPGTGKSAILINTSKNFLVRKEPVIYITLDDSPQAIYEFFNNFGWNIHDYINKGLFHIVDGFSYRLGKYRTSTEGVIREFSPESLEKTIYTTVDTVNDLGLEGNGLIVIDSLNEIVSKLGVTQTIEFVKSVRALVSKLRKVLVMMILHSTTETISQLQLEIEYMVDGVIETRIDPNLQEIGIPLKQLLIKKMRGAPTNPLWIPYMITSEGIAAVDQQKLASLVKSRLKEALVLGEKK